MEEWQRQLKAEKEAERQKKMESASMLQGYRGSVKEEDLKLKKDKETERQKKLESASMLQGYRGGVAEEDLKLKALREEERKGREDAERTLHSYQAKEVKTIPKERKSMGPPTAAYPTPVNAGSEKNHDYLAGIEFGNVSERAAALSAAADSSVLDTSTTKTVVAKSDAPPSAMVGPSADSTISTQQEVATVSDSPLLVDVPQMIDSPVMVSPTTMAEDEIVAVEMMPPSLEQEPAPTAINGSATTTYHNGLAATIVPAPTITAAEASVRFDVLFSFGLVTVHQDPTLTSYMAAVQNIVSTALQNKKDGNIVFDPCYGPFVRDKQWDTKYVSRSGRADVRRLVVTAAVPIFAKSSSLRSEAKKSVVEALQAAIQSGDFLSLAQV